jgi:hypothetical protein
MGIVLRLTEETRFLGICSPFYRNPPNLCLLFCVIVSFSVYHPYATHVIDFGHATQLTTTFTILLTATVATLRPQP